MNQPRRVKQNKYADQAAVARETWRREMACDSKKPYATEEAAVKTGNTAYQCRYCGKWHASSKFNRMIKTAEYFANRKAGK